MTDLQKLIAESKRAYDHSPWLCTPKLLGEVTDALEELMEFTPDPEVMDELQALEKQYADATGGEWEVFNCYMVRSIDKSQELAIPLLEARMPHRVGDNDDSLASRDSEAINNLGFIVDTHNKLPRLIQYIRDQALAIEIRDRRIASLEAAFKHEDPDYAEALRDLNHAEDLRVVVYSPFLNVSDAERKVAELGLEKILPKVFKWLARLIEDAKLKKAELMAGKEE